MPAALDKRIDWKDLYGKWVTAKAKGVSMNDFASQTGHHPNNLYSKFKEMRMELIKDEMAEIVQKGVHIVAKKLNENEDQLNPDFVLKATTQMADRIGLSPQNTQVNVQTNVAIGISLVAKDDAESIKSMLGGEDVSGNVDAGREELPDSGTLE
jgi:hypothetical protein